MINLRTNYILIIFAILFSGCRFEQEDIFGESAASRLNNSLTNIETTLTSAKNGWVMEYFTSSEGPGYSMLMRFTPNGEVVIAAKNNLVNNHYSEEASMYSIIGDYGPVLSFNTYNKILHLFSTPERPAGWGMGGDYEFIVQQVTGNSIFLLGKKRGTAIILTRLPDGVEWKSYLDKLTKNHYDIFGDDPLFFVSGNESMLALNGQNLVFDFPENIFNSLTSMPFVVDFGGIRFYEPFTIRNNRKVQSFTLNNEGTKLVANDDPNTYFTSTSLNTYFANSTADFAFDTERMSNHFTEPYNRLVTQMNQQYNGERDINFIALAYKPGYGKSFMLATTPLGHKGQLHHWHNTNSTNRKRNHPSERRRYIR
jgi:hypothetical protein